MAGTKQQAGAVWGASASGGGVPGWQLLHAAATLPDRLVALAAKAVRAPVAIASLVDAAGRCTVLGQYGLDEPPLDRGAECVQFGPCAEVATTGLPVIITDTAGSTRRSAAGLRDSELGAYVGFPVRDGDGEVIGCLAVADRQRRDWSVEEISLIDDAAQLFATGRMEHAQRPVAPELRFGRAYFAAVLEALDSGVAACASDGRLVLFNRALREAWGALDEAGLTIPEWLARFAVRHPDGRPMKPEETAMRRALAGERVAGVEQVLDVPGRGPRRFSSVGFPVLAPDGERLGAVTTIRDVTEERRAEELAVELSHAKDEYVALVGHELRTPLATIASYTELIGDGPDETPLSELRPLLATVGRNTAVLIGIIDDLLDLAALDSGHAELRPVRVEVAALVAACWAASHEVAQAQGVELRADVPHGLTIMADPGRLRQVLDQLVGNAVKFSPGGGRVDVRAENQGGTVVLTVSDSGLGVPEGERDLVLGRFYRGAAAREHGIPGSGLGLAAVRIIIERHHGTFALAPRDPTGMTATVTLPAGP
jgi:two-component system phosphate regulon sensor histidine kinase PhoR